MSSSWNPDAPYGYDVFTHTEVIPKPPPVLRWRWTVGPVRPRTLKPMTERFRIIPIPQEESEFTMQLTADQQVELSISGEDRYGNPVDLGEATPNWTSSDESIVQVFVDDTDSSHATAAAVGPVGEAVVTVANQDSTISGALAIQVVAGDVTEVVVTASEPTDKPVPEQRRR